MTKTQNTGKTALVIGCGIGGPVAAMALQRVGIDAAVFEAYDGSAEFVGSFLNTASNGLDALKAIDAHGEVLARGFPTPRMVMWSGTGKRLGEVANGLRLPDGTVSITVERGHLHGALRREALRRGIRIEQREEARLSRARRTAVSSRASRTGPRLMVTCLSERTGFIHEFDSSSIRAAPSPGFTGQLSLGGRAQLAALQPTPQTFHMIFGRRGFFGYSVRDHGDVYWFANMAWDGGTTRESLGAVSPAEWKRPAARSLRG